MIEVTSVNEIKIAMLNVSGINTSLDLVIRYIETKNIDVLLLTETFLTSGNLNSSWSQYHNYAQPHGAARKGFEGLTFLVRPNFPHHIHSLNCTNPFQLTIVIGSTLTLHGFYLPPSMPLPVYQNMLSSIDFNSTPSVLILGDLNTRLGSYLGDTRTIQPRASYLRNWLTINNVQLWNRSLLAPNSWTYESKDGASIIDFFISKADIFVENPTMKIEKETNLNSDHHLLRFNFKLKEPPKLLPPLSAEPRRLWKLQRLNEIEINDLYVSHFYSATLKIHQEIKFFMYHQHEKFKDLFFTATVPERDQRQYNLEKSRDDQINSRNGFDFFVTETPQQFIDRIGKELENAIFESLDLSVTPAKPRCKDWNLFGMRIFSI